MHFDYKFHMLADPQGSEPAALMGVADVTHHVFFEGRKVGYQVNLAEVVAREVVSKGWQDVAEKLNLRNKDGLCVRKVADAEATFVVQVGAGWLAVRMGVGHRVHSVGSERSVGGIRAGNQIRCLLWTGYCW